MSVRVTIVDGPIDRASPRVAAAMRGGEAGAGGVGALLVFEGLVRGLEAGELIEGLEYEVYEPMATRQMELIGRGLVEELGLAGIEVWHSRGRVGVGECSLRVVVESSHRREGLAAMERFIDALKRDVPIWKKVAGRG